MALSLTDLTTPTSLGRLGAADASQYDSQGFAIRSRAGNKTRAHPDAAGAPTAQPFWNVFGTLRLQCADYNTAERIAQVENKLKAQGYEIGAFRLAGELGRRGAASPNDGRPSIPLICGMGLNTNPNELALSLYKKGGTPEQAKKDVLAELARLGTDLGDTGNFVVESFRSNVTDVVEKRVAAASRAVTDQAEKGLTLWCGVGGKDCERMVRNGIFLLGALGLGYVVVNFVRPALPSPK